MIDSDIAVIEFRYGDSMQWHVWTLVGPERKNEYAVYAEDLVGITGIRVRPLNRQTEVEAIEVKDES